MDYITREDALALLKKYNKDPFHMQHALTVEAVMRWYAKELGYGDAEEYWGIVGLEGGFTLRCLQRLSLPDLATRLCSWRNNRCTRGQSIPVLSY